MKPSKSKKSKNSKSPEELTTLITKGYSTGTLSDCTCSWVTNHILRTSTIDEQILGIRNLISIISEANDGNKTTLYDQETIQKLADVITFLFFQLKSSSCLKSVIANSINKASNSKNDENDWFALSFQKYIENVIETLKNSRTSADITLAQPFVIIQSELFENFISCVTRSLENNCYVAILATTRKMTEIVNLIENLCLIPIVQHEKNDLLKLQNDDKLNLLDFVSRIIRLTLSLQSLSRKSLSSTCIDTLRKFQTFYHFNTYNELKFDTETESNLALLMVNETKLQHKNDNIEVIVDYVEENLQLNSSVNNERSASFVIHNINALAISSELENLFQSSREKDSDPSCTRFEILYDMLVRWAVYQIDSHLTVAHASATYNLVNRVQKFLQLKVEKAELNHIANIHQIFQKMESYVLGILCHNADKVKYIARNILNVLVVIYREYLPTEQQLHQLIQKCMDMPWEQKIKYLALLSIFKHSSNQLSASVKAAKDVELLYPDMPSILTNQLLSVHPSLESHCAELYEVLVYNDYFKNVSLIKNDEHENEWLGREL